MGDEVAGAAVPGILAGLIAYAVVGGLLDYSETTSVVVAVVIGVATWAFAYWKVFG